MSLLLNGAKTMTIAGTEMQCLEIYTGEAYTLPISFTNSDGTPANALSPAPWTINATAKFYTVDNVAYSGSTATLGNLNLNSPQPSSSAYTIVTNFTNQASGKAYLYLGNNITNTGNLNIPQITLANNTANSTLVIVTLQIAKQSVSNSALTDVNREPIGFIVRYQ